MFAVIHTGAGKTYTMLGTDEDPGIMAHALNDLFLEMDKTKDDMTYSVRLSYLEVTSMMRPHISHENSLKTTYNCGKILGNVWKIQSLQII